MKGEVSFIEFQFIVTGIVAVVAKNKSKCTVSLESKSIEIKYGHSIVNQFIYFVHSSTYSLNLILEILIRDFVSFSDFVDSYN